MGNYVQAVWRTRFFWLSLVRMDLRSRYRGSILGLGWSLLHPIAMTAIFCVVFREIFHEDLTYYAPFLLTGLACWNFVQHATLQGCQCFFQGEAYIKQYPAPLAIYPLRTVLGGGFHFLIALGLAVIVAWWLRGIQNPLALFSLLPSVMLLVVLGWSLGTLAGLANVHFQDTHHLCQVGFQVLFYLTPIMYPPRILQGGSLSRLLDHNPLTAYLRLLREPLMDGHASSRMVFAAAGLATLVVFLTAVGMLYRLERRLIFYL